MLGELGRTKWSISKMTADIVAKRIVDEIFCTSEGGDLSVKLEAVLLIANCLIGGDPDILADSINTLKRGVTSERWRQIMGDASRPPAA
jgi:NADPH-dependent 7-cyano-7-deazaguanine reductase QueF